MRASFCTVATVLAALLLAAPGPGAASPAGAVRVEVAPAVATVGDRVTVTLTVDSPAGEPQFPDPGRQWGESDVLEAHPAERIAGGAAWRRQLVVAAFRPGPLELPAPVVRLPDGAAARPAGPIRIEIRPLLPAEPEPVEPKPAAPPVALPRDPAFWWLLALLGGLVLALGGWLVELERRRRAATRPVREVPPLEELEAALGGLGPGSAAEPGHAVLSLALRRYLGRSLAFHAAESTTSEIQRELAARRLDTSLIKGAVHLLRDCDGVKFARRPTTGEELTRRVAATRELAAAVEAHLRPPIEGAGSTPARGAAA